MRIESLHCQVVALPADEPLAGAAENPGGTRPTVVIEIATDEGVTGIGFSFLAAGVTPALRTLLELLGERIVGCDPLCVEAVVRRAREGTAGAGPAGLLTLALAAIDIALWDIKGKVAGLPLWKLLGGTGDPVPTYASGAMMRGLAPDVAANAARTLVAQGFRAMKMQLALPGLTNVEREVRHAQLIRDTIGPDIELMCDINQRWRVDQAIAIGRRLEDIGFAWLEDITAHDDYRGLARIAAALATPLAGGEYVYGLTPFRHLLEAGALDIVMIDPFRAGGITPWLKIAALAEAFNLPVVSHLAPELQVHLVGAVPNGLTVEYMPWSVRLFEDVPRPRDGMLTMPTGPGLGLTLDRAALRRFAA